MIQRILKIELLLLFVLTIASFYYFYFYSTLPDNIFSISSRSSHISIISYYFFSIVTIIGFFIGPWIFLPFLTFSLFYSFILSKRSLFFDNFIFVTGAIFYLGVLNYFYPTLVGDGLELLVNQYIGKLNLFIISILFLSLTLFMTFRMNFVLFLKRVSLFLFDVPIFIKKIYEGILNYIVRFYRWNQKIFSYLFLVTKIFKRSAESVDKKEDELVQLKKTDLTVPIINQDISSAVNSESSYSEINTYSEADISTAEVSTKPSVEIKRKASFKNIHYKNFVANTITSPRSVKDKILKDPDRKYFAEITSALEAKLEEFKVDGSIINVLKGPVVDTFELELGPGIKVSKVLGLSNDLSLALAGAPIRIEHTTVGRTTIGIEVPRDPREFIYLDEVLDSDEYAKNQKRKLPIAMGHNVVGESYVIDLASAPHMLVAGETGSGKSVFVHSMLVSLLMQKSPQSLRLLMIDPKQIEMMPYEKLPHLLMPVITQDKEASLALLWACQEMDKRYSILKEFAVRNIEGFNDKLKEATPAMLASIHQYYQDENFELPYIVIVVDEYADLILGPAGKEIENSICRLAQKARAAGIHVILTTQRPSAAVVTGLIKANFPTRVSLKVASAIDSRVILDKNGAEKLLGNGDMLYKKGTELVRIHSPFVSEQEVSALVKKLSELDTSFDTHAMDFLENGGTDGELIGDFSGASGSNGNISDDLFQQAVDFVLTQKMASTSSLQRKFRIGYNKAADLADLLEKRGVVGPSQGSKGREVFGAPTD